MHRILSVPAISKIHIHTALAIGCTALTLSSYLRIPFYPISFTMHTFVLWMIGSTLPKNKAMWPALFYLLLATVGLPVFGWHSNPLWFLGKSAGYLIAFPIAAYLTAYFKEKNALIWGMLLGQIAIYSLGFLGLIPHTGVSIAFYKGVLLFIPSDLLKILLAYYLIRR